ncbi:AEX-2 neuropeptide Receptor, partial [Trichostrongylus colubriformis]
LVDQDVLLGFVRWMDYFIFVSTILSSFLQIYVLQQANRHIRKGAGDQCLHVFLFSMTMGDFIQTAICYPIEAIARILDIRDELPMILNVTVHFLTWVSLSGSSLSLVLLNLDKLLYFKYPLRYSSYVTRRRGISSALIAWMCCVIFVAGAWYFECFKCEENCSTIYLLRERWGMYLLFSVSVCVVPTLTSLAVALYIVKVVTSHRKKLAEGLSPSKYV